MVNLLDCVRGGVNEEKVKKVDKDFVYGVLFVTLLAFGAKTPVNCTAKWFYYCTSDFTYLFLISLVQRGKIARKRQFTGNLVSFITFLT